MVQQLLKGMFSETFRKRRAKLPHLNGFLCRKDHIFVICCQNEEYGSWHRTLYCKVICTFQMLLPSGIVQKERDRLYRTDMLGCNCRCMRSVCRRHVMNQSPNSNAWSLCRCRSIAARDIKRIGFPLAIKHLVCFHMANASNRTVVKLQTVHECHYSNTKKCPSLGKLLDMLPLGTRKFNVSRF